MISPNSITEISRKKGVGWIVVEKDYFLTLLLEGIAHNDDLRKNWVIKRGAALRKICFKRYRHSEDLDFTLINPMSGEEIIAHLEEVFAYVKKEHNAEFRIKEEYSKAWFHDIKIQFMGLKGIKNTITLDLISDEIIVDKIKEGRIVNPYYKKVITIKVYSLEEILAEKLRSILQRTRVRDYYDVWYMLHHVKIDPDKLKKIFSKKVKYKHLEFKDKRQLLEKNKIEQAKAYYQRQIAHQLKRPPEFDKIIKELEIALDKIDLY